MRTGKLPVLLGGCGLAFGAAFANMGVFLEAGTSVSHLTGDLVKLSVDILRASPGALWELGRVGLAMTAFFLGAMTSGFWFHHPDLEFTRPYRRAIFMIGLLFLASAFCLGKAPWIGIVLAAYGCGLQNALASRYRGIVLRTTHLTGLITDFGISLGMRLRGLDVAAWKLLVPGLLILAFFLGGLCGATMFLQVHANPILLTGIGYCGVGSLWMILKASSRFQSRV